MNFQEKLSLYEGEELTLVTETVMKMAGAEKRIEKILILEKKVKKNSPCFSERWYETTIASTQVELIDSFTETELKALAKLISEANGEIPDPENLTNDERRLAEMAYGVVYSTLVGLNNIIISYVEELDTR